MIPSGIFGGQGCAMKKNRGFSLLELLIVVAIILIIATIAVPALLKSRQAANQSHAVANLRTLNTGEVLSLEPSGAIRRHSRVDHGRTH